MKKSEKIFLIALFSILTITVTIFAVIGLSSCQTAYADYNDLNGSEILNFNQLIPNQYISFYHTGTGWFSYSSSANIYSGDVLYIRLNASNKNNPILLGTGASTYGQTIIQKDDIVINETIDKVVVATGNYNYIGTYYEVNGVQFDNFNIINLSTMFGRNNEPNLEQCRTIFTADYFAYTIGQAITLNGINGYQEGVQSIYDSLQYKLTASHIYNTAYAYIGTKENYTYTYTDNSNTYTVIVTGTGNANNVLAIPLGTVIEQGKTVQVKGAYMGFATQESNVSNTTGYITLCYLYGNDLIPILFTTTFEVANNDGIITFSVPFAMDTLYICESSTKGYITRNDSNGNGFGLFNTEVLVVELDANALVENAYNQGYDKAVENYAPGTTNYLNIYNRGVKDAETSASVFQDTWSFVASAFEGVGSLLAVELIPNVPIGLFVALPLLLGLIFFIVKVTKGGD